MTGVQTCALPIRASRLLWTASRRTLVAVQRIVPVGETPTGAAETAALPIRRRFMGSEFRSIAGLVAKPWVIELNRNWNRVDARRTQRGGHEYSRRLLPKERWVEWKPTMKREVW